MESQTNPTSNPPTARRRLWLWFLAGFLPVFIAMLFFVRITALHPSGQYAAPYTLGQFYRWATPALFEAKTLGPANSNDSLLLQAASIHLLASLAAGAAATALGWYRSKRRHPI